MQVMKKAIIVGGSNGIGLAVAKTLAERGYHPCIIDVAVPDPSLNLCEDAYSFYSTDLRDFDEALFRSLSQDENVEALVITAGLGRVADFEYLHIAEIEKLFRINTVAGLKIVRLFYERIRSERRFYTAMMGSVAGLMSSPAFSVYAASKAAVCRFIESVNVELEVGGFPNRILNVSPGSVQGTRFNGGENRPEALKALADGIIDRMMAGEELYIPDYDTVFGRVLERYHADPHKYGVESYQYKLNSGRLTNEHRVQIGYLSGTFDLFHVGHLNLLRRAKAMCDYLIVGVHPDASHKGKKTFIPFEERKQMVAACRYVDRVVDSVPEDSEAWELWHFSRLFVGSDYKGTERFANYERYFADKNVEIVYFPYTQGTCSTQIRQVITDADVNDGNKD